MDFKSYIDLKKYKRIGQETHIVISGWCFALDGRTVEYQVKINGKKVESELKRMARSDVKEKMKKFNPGLSSGFRLIVDTDFEQEPQLLEVFASAGEKRTCILKMNQKALEKIKESRSINYHLDYIRVEDKGSAIKYNIGGWAYSGRRKKSTLSYELFDAEKKEVDKTLRLTNREDLYRQGMVKKEERYCGFVLEFLGDDTQNYVLEISDGPNTIRKTLNYKEIKKANRRKAQYGTAKTILTHLSMENVVKGCRYLINNGTDGLIERLQQGVNTNGMSYGEWYAQHKPTKEELKRQKQRKFEYRPKYSLLVPTYNTPINFLREMIDSVCQQSYDNWELCIGEGSEGNAEVEAVLAEYAAKDSRIKYKILDKNLGIAGNTNGALELATGDYIGLFDHDDLLAPNALYEVTRALQKEQYDILYTDEDKVEGEEKVHTDPNFKPDWSPDLFYSHNYITHFFVVKKEIMDKVGGFLSEYDGAQDYDLMFRCIENSETIKHIPMILYHWRIHGGSVAGDPSSKMYAYEAGRKAIQDHFERTGIQAEVEHMPLWGMYHCIYETPGNPLVSVIIPNKDHTDDLDKCLESLYNVNSYRNFEVIIIENNSEKEETFHYYETVQEKYPNVTVVTWTEEFNYAAINNYGVTFAKGDYLLFLNNDTEVITETAVSELLGVCMREDVGIVGAKLLYEDDTVQHAGIVIGFGGFAGHVFTEIDKDDYGYMVRPRINCNYSAVTAACMMVDKASFDEVHGFTEAFKVGLNDVDFCLKVRETGKLVVYNAHSLWHHYESKSRGYEDTEEKLKRFEGEIALFQERWMDILKKGDPYYNRNFPIEYGPFRLG